MFKMIILCLGYIGIITVGIHSIKIESRYVLKDCVVIERNKNMVTALDKSGNIWQYTDDKYIQTGKNITLYMSDNGTINDITDDKVMSVQY